MSHIPSIRINHLGAHDRRRGLESGLVHEARRDARLAEGGRPTLRERQTAQTRLTIIEALVDLINDGEVGSESITIPLVAGRAGVSVPTVYRYFRTKEALFDAITEAALEQIGGEAILHPTVDNLSATIRAVFEQMHQYEAFVRVTLATEYGRQIRRRRRPQHDTVVRSVLDSIDADLTPGDYRRLYVMIQMLTSRATYLYLTDHGKFDAADAAKMASTTIEALIERVVQGSKSTVTNA